MARPILPVMAWVNLILLALVTVSALALAGLRQEARDRFQALEAAREERDALNTTWSQLTLEQASVAAHRRIEPIARTRLGLALPQPEQILILGRDEVEP